MKKVLITGTSSGIGKAIALHLLEKGYTVIGTSRNPKTGTDIRQLTLDITDENSVIACVAAAEKEMGGIDVLINNAGIALAGSVEDTTLNEAKHQFNTNYFGAVSMIKAVLPGMKAKKEGLIMNISSLGGMIGIPFQAHYCGSKFALEGLVEGLRLELRPFGIKVLNINPGDFKTEITANRQWSKVVSTEYEMAFKVTMKKYEESEQEGPDPILIAKLVEKLIQQKSGHKIRHVIGKSDQKMLIPMRKVIGDRLFEKLLIKAYDL